VTPLAVIATALLLGVFVLAGGGYGVLYGAGRMRRSRRLLSGGYACYGAQVLVVAVILAVTPLALGWKALVVLSALAYAFIPPVTWRYLERLHASEGSTQ
jgi:ABC-type Na+ efflux pump permease subunit